ncbi:Nicotianamine synthase [Rhynchospora pubera]|uniref:Nicotianamine synthase n=1 Tax=Rhynchospora pubera TaxID=906938 RepID=A0AAV8FQJ2_9POAL|nr:Nicotianamine synthase [Rhynchospora pubera]KAJ4764432.1 Nicotianamine synthase [Rhynchospora pubera]KAJ4793321.1 Nicotianamine synthase [Rhynchospora pubera]KAJ4817142.1 Nicotianamine synthase [Rhynchospora pubera]
MASDLMINQEEQTLIQKISSLYDSLSSLPSLRPSPQVNSLFTELVLACIPPSEIDVSKLDMEVQEMRSKLIELCSNGEGLLESHYSDILVSYDNPLAHLSLFPYYTNYLKLSQLEFELLLQHVHGMPMRVAFIGSGPLPLSLLVLATYHMTTTRFHGYDRDSSATARARKLLKSDADMASRVEFRTADVMSLTHVLSSYDVVFLAALVGIDKEEKERVIEHLNRYMSVGSVLVVRSAHGARGFLYPVVGPDELKGFEMASIYHPQDEVINSVIVAKKLPPVHAHVQGEVAHVQGGLPMRTCNCCEREAIMASGCKMEELAREELQS